jgi:hypothetical protein
LKRTLQPNLVGHEKKVHECSSDQISQSSIVTSGTKTGEGWEGVASRADRARGRVFEGEERDVEEVVVEEAKARELARRRTD